MGVLTPQLAPGGQALGPGQDEGHRVAPGVGVDLVEPERRVRSHGPAPGVVGHGLGPAQQVHPGEVGVDVGLAQEVDEVAAGPGLLALPGGAVVGREDDDRVVQLVQLGQSVEQPPDALVEAVDHARVDLHVPGEQGLLGLGQLVPGADVVALLGVAGRQLGAFGDDPQLLLTGEAPGPDLVPARGVRTPVALDVAGLRVQRGVAGGVGQVGEPRLAGMAGPQLLPPGEAAVREVVGQVVPVGVAVDLDHLVVAHQAVGVVQVREPVEDPVEALEAPLAGPRVLGAGGVEVGVLGQMPLAGHERGPARIPVDLRRGRRVLGQLHGVAGVAGVRVGDVADPGPVAVQPGEQGRPGRRAHRGDVEVRVADAPLRQGVHARGADLAAVAAEIRVAEVVDEDDQHVGRALGRLHPRRPPRIRPRDRPPDPSLESLIGVSHGRPAVGEAAQRSGAPGETGPGRRSRRSGGGAM